MLKVGFPDDESEHEDLALQHWHGRGAVRLLRADPHRRALLLERLHPEDLTERWDLEACEVVGRPLRADPRPARRRSCARSRAYIERWTADLGRGCPAAPRSRGGSSSRR